MKFFLIWFLLTAFIEGVFIFCEQNGIGNIPRIPRSKEEVINSLPFSFLMTGILTYVFLKAGKKK
jgi:hypothetical protein